MGGVMTTPKRPDELEFWIWVKAGNYPRKAAELLGMNANRAAYLCQKWTDRHVYDYGVNVLAGWPELEEPRDPRALEVYRRELMLLEGPKRQHHYLKGGEPHAPARVMRAADQGGPAVVGRSDGPPLTAQDLERVQADVARMRAEGRVRVNEAIDAQEHKGPSAATAAAKRDVAAVRAAQDLLDGRVGPVSVPEYTGGVVRAPDRGGPVPRRRIDSAQWEGNEARFDIPVWVESGPFIRYEFDPCPRWMTPNTYRWLLARLRQGMKETPNAPLDALHAWTARHVWVVTEPPKLVSSAGAYDLVGVALELAREVKRRGLPIDSLARPRRRRLLDSW
jgi:hypothetical protein